MIITLLFGVRPLLFMIHAIQEFTESDELRSRETQGFTESVGRSQPAIFRRHEASYENPTASPLEYFTNHGLAESEAQSVRSKSTIVVREQLSYENTYYNKFSKYVLANAMQPVEPVVPAFTYQDSRYSGFRIEKYKLPDMKHVAKYYKLPVSGNKPIVADRILSFFRQTTAAIYIQSRFRGNIVRIQQRLRGIGYRNTAKCVNECDFYSLEPLTELDPTVFFSYSDAKEFVYGFDMFSLITLLRKTGKIMNPYNREQIPYDVCTSLLRVYHISRILFPARFQHTNAGNDIPQIVRPPQPPPPRRQELATVSDSPPISVYESDQTPVAFDFALSRETVAENTLTAIRSQPLDSRIRELFMEINLLGNYAESRWFLELDRLRLARFYQFYYDWWNGRSRLPAQVRNSICILADPFADIRLVHLYPTTDIVQYREACVNLMELMVYTGIDVEYRKLGVLHILSILTMVSLPARNAMPWLYESLFM